MTFLSSAVACWRSACSLFLLLLLLSGPQASEASGNKKEVELAALWCSHRFFPCAPGGCPASTLQCKHARVRGVGDSVLNIYFGIYKYVNFFFVWASLTPHTTSFWERLGLLCTASHAPSIPFSTSC